MGHRFRFFVEGVRTVDDVVQLSSADQSHLRVIRAGAGEVVEVVDEAGVVHEATVLAGGAQVELGRAIEQPRTDLPDVVLYAGVLPGARWDVLVDAAVQAGAAAIVPVVQSTRELALVERRAPRMGRVVEAAAKQSKRVRLPRIEAPVRLRELPAGTRGVVLDERSEVPLVDVDVAACTLPGGPDLGTPGTLALLVGPAAGLTLDDADALEHDGWIGASLGPTVLRSELAAAIAVSTALQLLQSATRLR